MAYVWEFNTHGDVFTYDNITVKASDLCYIDENKVLRSVLTGPIDLAYVGEDNIIRDKNGEASVSVTNASRIGAFYKYKDDDFSAEVGGFYKVDTTNQEVTISLPENPKDNDTIHFLDIKGTWGDNKITLHKTNEDHLIMGEDDDSDIDITNYFFSLMYCDGDWRVL